MAPTERYTAIPASLWASDSPFLDLSARAQWLYLRLWTSEARDAAGFLPYQPTLWAKSSTSTTISTVEAAAGELRAVAWLSVDFDAEKAWLCRFIEEDTYHSPNQYVAALKKVGDQPSWMLRDAAWKEVQRLGTPVQKSEPAAVREKMQRRVDAAYDALRERMIAAGLKGYRRGSEGVSKPSNVNATDAYAGGVAGETAADNDHADADREAEYAAWIDENDPDENWCTPAERARLERLADQNIRDGYDR
jgi:hypothetical protein